MFATTDCAERQNKQIVIVPQESTENCASENVSKRRQISGVTLINSNYEL